MTIYRVDWRDVVNTTCTSNHSLFGWVIILLVEDTLNQEHCWAQSPVCCYYTNQNDQHNNKQPNKSVGKNDPTPPPTTLSSLKLCILSYKTVFYTPTHHDHHNLRWVLRVRCKQGKLKIFSNILNEKEAKLAPAATQKHLSLAQRLFLA